MAKRQIVHVVFQTIEQIDRYFKEYHLTISLGQNWGVIRVAYPEGYYDGCFVFAAVSRLDNRELDIPRAVIEIWRCSEAVVAALGEMLVDIQPYGPEPAWIVSHIVFDTYEEVEDHFNKAIENADGGDIKIFRTDVSDDSHSDYRDSHVFLAFDMSTGMEVNIPRAVLPKNKCSKSDSEEIEAVDFIEYLEGVDVEDSDESDDNSSDGDDQLDDGNPVDKDRIN